MVMLSELRRLHLVDEQQRRARLLDVAVALPDVDYPPVTQVLFQQHAECMSLPWEAIRSLDRQARHLHVIDLEAGQILLWAVHAVNLLRSQLGPAAECARHPIAGDVRDQLVQVTTFAALCSTHHVSPIVLCWSTTLRLDPRHALVTLNLVPRDNCTRGAPYEGAGAALLEAIEKHLH